jgi:hypothetical protein
MRATRRLQGWKVLRGSVYAVAIAATSCSQNGSSSGSSAGSSIAGAGTSTPATQAGTTQPAAQGGNGASPAAGVPAHGAASGAGGGALANAGAGTSGMTGASAGSGGAAVGSNAAGRPSMPTSPSAPSMPTTPTMPSTPSGGSGPFPAVGDFLADGPFDDTELDRTGPNNNYTVYLPKMLAPNGAKNPIVGWMSGGSTNPTQYPLLPHLATHGFVVVASNTTPGLGDEVNLGKEIIAGIEWALAENMRDGSMLFGKLDATKIASMGYSMGSLATFTIANDPRLTTTVHISGGNMQADRINNLRAPAAFICGIPDPGCSDILSTACDIAAANCDTDFMNAKTPVFYANFRGGHLGILSEPNQGPITKLVTAWLRWKLMRDDTLTHMFVGDQCQVCMDSTLKVQQKGLQ